MARGKTSGNISESGRETDGDSNVVIGTDGSIAAENSGGNKESINGEIFDPAKLDERDPTRDTVSGEPWFPKRNKRGRKPKANKEAAQDLNGLLWMIHAGLSELTGIEEFALDPTESKELADSIARVQAFYPTSILSPIALAWTGLIVTAGKVYGTRVIAYTAKKKKKPNIVEIPLPPGTAQAN